MADTGSLWTVQVSAFLEHPINGSIWLFGQERDYRVPSFHFQQDKSWLHAEQLIDRLATIIPVPFNLLRYSSYLDESRKQVEISVFLETSQDLPDRGGCWIFQNEINSLVAPDEQGQVENYFFNQAPERVPAERAPWAKHGWYSRAIDWISTSLTTLGYSPPRKLKTLRTWGISCLLTVETINGEMFYFKAVLDEPLFVNEGLVTQGLAKLFPEIIQAPVAVNSEERWMLTPRIEGSIQWGGPLEERIQLVKTWAGYQKESVRRIEELLAVGCIDRRLDWLAEQVEDLFGDQEAVAALTPEENSRLQRIAPALINRCRKLAASEIPPGLVHGDLHGGNVAVCQDGITIFDWTDACVTHPFLDMLIIYNEENAEEAKILQNAYLAEWEDFAQPERLLELWELAHPVFSLHHALSYHTLVKHLEPAAKVDLDWGTPYFLRKIIQFYDGTTKID